MWVSFLRQSWLAVASSLVFGLLVAGVYGGLEGRIAQNQKRKMAAAMRALLPAAATFEEVRSADGQRVEYAVGQANGGTVGYVIEQGGKGFADEIVLLIAADGRLERVVGTAVLKSNETPGFGDQIKNAEFRDQFTGAPAEELAVVKSGDRGAKDREIVAITGATISSDAVVRIVNEGVAKLKQAVAGGSAGVAGQ